MTEESRVLARYPYTSVGEHDIRLLRFLSTSNPDQNHQIHCSLHQHERFFEKETLDKPEFTALSYVWGNPAKTKTITVDGHDFGVTTNLYGALSSLQRHDHPTKRLPIAPPFYWIDSICINQKDIIEKSLQVHQMWRVYAEAYKVISWLGPDPSDQSKKIFDDIRDNASPEWPYEIVSSLEPDNSPPDYRALRSFLHDNQYFRRTWILSEYVQARQLELMSGRNKLNIDHIRSDILENQSGSGSVDYPAVMAHRAGGSRFVANGRTGELQFHEFHRILALYSESTCSDPRDTVFAMLSNPVIKNLTSTISLRPDYSLDAFELSFLVAEYASGLVRSSFKPIALDAIELALALCSVLWEPRLTSRTLADALREIPQLTKFPLSRLSRWIRPDVLELRSGTEIPCTSYFIRVFVGLVFTGTDIFQIWFDEDPGDNSERAESVHASECAVQAQMDGTSIPPATQALLREWPAIQQRWFMEESVAWPKRERDGSVITAFRNWTRTRTAVSKETTFWPADEPS